MVGGSLSPLAAAPTRALPSPTTDNPPVAGVAKRYRATAGKKFQCLGFGECKMAFDRIGKLERHIRMHTGERPFICHCTKRFSRLDNLRNHAQAVHPSEGKQNEAMVRELGRVYAARRANAAGSKSTTSNNVTSTSLWTNTTLTNHVSSSTNSTSRTTSTMNVKHERTDVQIGLCELLRRYDVHERPGTSTGWEGWMGVDGGGAGFRLHIFMHAVWARARFQDFSADISELVRWDFGFARCRLFSDPDLMTTLQKGKKAETRVRKRRSETTSNAPTSATCSRPFSPPKKGVPTQIRTEVGVASPFKGPGSDFLSSSNNGSSAFKFPSPVSPTSAPLAPASHHSQPSSPPQAFVLPRATVSPLEEAYSLPPPLPQLSHVLRRSSSWIASASSNGTGASSLSPPIFSSPRLGMTMSSSVRVGPEAVRAAYADELRQQTAQLQRVYERGEMQAALERQEREREREEQEAYLVCQQQERKKGAGAACRRGTVLLYGAAASAAASPGAGIFGSVCASASASPAAAEPWYRDGYPGHPDSESVHDIRHYCLHLPQGDHPHPAYIETHLEQTQTETGFPELLYSS
ncbi:hypothetical protein C8R43DRAFT_942638 [Mycena crocata]|nr:hypothetical protein C8R43DRAFT_942638 [Mycena crocata]